MIRLNNLFSGFGWSNQKKNFDNTYTFRVRFNYHVIKFKHEWAVHAEGQKDIYKFAHKQAAIDFAKSQACAQQTEALIHDESGAIETAWIFSIDAYPQKKLRNRGDYPIEEHPGKKVL